MKLTISLFFLFQLSFFFAQTYDFKPQWTVGTIKTISYSVETVKTEDGEITEEDQIEYDAELEVVQVNPDHYLIELRMENIAMVKLVKMFEKLEEEFDNYEDLKLIYKVNKEDGSYELTNWKEAQNFVTSQFESVKKMLEKKNKEAASLWALLSMPLKMAFASEANVQDYFANYVDPLFIPFQRSYELHTTITETETAELPFNKSDSMTVTNFYTLTKMDETKQLATIENRLEMDMSAMVEMIKGMLLKMIEGMDLEKEELEAEMKEMDEIEFLNETVQTLLFNTQTTWLTNNVAISDVTVTDPRTKKKERTVSTLRMGMN